MSTVQAADGQMRDERQCVRIILPTAWAAFDLSLYHSYNDIVDGIIHHTSEHSLSVERSQLVSDREHFVSTTNSFWAQKDNNTFSVDIGTLVTITLNEEITAGFNCHNWFAKGDTGSQKVTCRTGPQWCVTSPSLNQTDAETSRGICYRTMKLLYTII